MNKSKFLKKSLAAVLAMLMIVAMIPLSAAAATAEVSSVKVVISGTQEYPATLNGNTWTAELPSAPASVGDVKIQVELKNGEGFVEHVGNTATKDGDKGIWNFNLTADEFEVKPFEAKFKVYDEATGTAGEKEYTVTYTIKGTADEVGVTSVTLDSQYGPTARDGDTFTITMPYGTTSSGNVTIVLSDKNANVSGGTPVPGKKGSFTIAGTTNYPTMKEIPFTVVAENGVRTQGYTVKFQHPAAFTSFSVDGQRKDAKINASDTPNPSVTVYLPYGTKADEKGKWQFTPTFETGYASVSVKAVKTDGTTTVALKSGEKVELSDFASLTENGAIADQEITLKVDYTGVASPVTWKLKLKFPTSDPDPVLKGLRLDNYIADINESAKTVTLTVPASKRVNNSSAVKILASTGAEVHATYTTSKATGADSEWKVFENGTLDLTKDSFTLRVTAAGPEDPEAEVPKKKAEDYKFIIKTAQVTDPVLTEFKLEDPNGKQYTATIGADGVVLFNLPYSVTNAKTGYYTPITAKANLVDWKLYYAMSEGSACAELADIPSGKKLSSSEAADTMWPGTSFDGKDTGTKAIKVYIDDNTYRNYKVAIKRGDPSTASAMSDFKITKLTGADTDNLYDDIKLNDNTFAASGSTALLVNVPYGKYSGFTTATVSAKIPDGAEIYYVDSTDGYKLKPLDNLTEFTEVVDGGFTNTLPSITTYKYDGVTLTPPVTGKLTPLELVVVSEAGVKSATDKSAGLGSSLVKDNMAANLGRTNYSTYTLTVKQNAASTKAKLDSFNVYDAATKTTIKGVITEGSNRGITLTLPYGFDDSVATDSIANTLYLDWSSSNNETIKLYKETACTTEVSSFTKLDFKDNGDPKSECSTITADSTNSKIKATADDILCVKVVSEATKYIQPNGQTVEYPITIKFDKEKTEAKLNSVTINNSNYVPNSERKVTVTLPRSAEVTALKPTFNVSDGAFVSRSNVRTSAKDSVIANGTQMNFTAPQTVYVYSENALNSTAYTIEVKVDDGFTDVKPGDWYYEAVMSASARGIIIGNPDGSFNPNGQVTRVQFATMMARVDGFNKAEWEGKTSKFSDMGSITGEAAAAVAYCADHGYINGDAGKTTFRPNDFISRQEMAVILCRVMKLDTTSVTVSNRFADDARIASWAKDYVYACVNANLILGQGNNTFNPVGNTTRAAAATVAVRVDNAK